MADFNGHLNEYLKKQFTHIMTSWIIKAQKLLYRMASNDLKYHAWQILWCLKLFAELKNKHMEKDCKYSLLILCEKKKN